MRNARKALAASFVVTFAGGCDSKSTQPPVTPTVDVGTTPAAASGVAMTTAAPAAPIMGDEAGAVAALEPAPTTGHVVQNPDGTCTWFGDRGPRRVNGHMVPMNPPHPHPVQCPPGGVGDGGSPN